MPDPEENVNNSEETNDQNPPEGNEDGKAGDDGGKKDGDGANTAPEKYDLKIPDGSILTNEDLERISGYAREKGLSQEQAAELLNVENEAANKGYKAYEAKQLAVLEAEQKRWIEEGKADPEIGGDKWEESAELAKRVVDKFGTKELKEGLEKSGLGNYHEFVKLMSRIGRAMDSDKLVIGSQSDKMPKSIAERLYGGSDKK